MLPCLLLVFSLLKSGALPLFPAEKDGVGAPLRRDRLLGRHDPSTPPSSLPGRREESSRTQSGTARLGEEPESGIGWSTASRYAPVVQRAVSRPVTTSFAPGPRFAQLSGEHGARPQAVRHGAGESVMSSGSTIAGVADQLGQGGASEQMTGTPHGMASMTGRPKPWKTTVDEAPAPRRSGGGRHRERGRRRSRPRRPSDVAPAAAVLRPIVGLPASTSGTSDGRPRRKRRTRPAPARGSSGG